MRPADEILAIVGLLVIGLWAWVREFRRRG